MMHGAVAKAVNEALTFISQADKLIDVIFLKVDNPVLKKIKKVGTSVNFENVSKETITPSEMDEKLKKSLKPPRLR